MEHYEDDLENFNTGIKIVSEDLEDLTAEQVLEQAKKAVHKVLVIGFGDDGYYYATNLDETGDAYILADHFKKFVMENTFG